jgi:hypothetical protein
MPVRVTYEDEAPYHRKKLLLSPNFMSQINWLIENVGDAEFLVSPWGYSHWSGRCATTEVPIVGNGWRIGIEYSEGNPTSFVYSVYLLIEDDISALKFKLENEFGWNDTNYEPK